MKKDSGFIGLVIMIIVALAAAHYFFDWSIFEAAETEEGQGTIAYVKEVLSTVWSYIKAPLLWLLDQITSRI